MKQKTILLVEDEVVTAMMEKKQLENEGYKVIHAITGEKAFELTSEKKEVIDLILMDIDLGKGMDGTEAAQKILNDQDIPILFLSSHIEKEIVNKTEKITNYGYVVKDSTFTVLDASIKMAFKLFDAKKNIQKQSMDVEAAYEKIQDANNELITTKNNLIESELRYKSLFQNLYNSFSLYEVIFDENDNPADYRILAVNPAYEKTVGVNASSVLGKTLLELFPRTEPIWLEIIRKVVLTGISELIEHYAVEIDKYIELLVYVPQKGQMAIIASDVTGRKKAYEKLRIANVELVKTQKQLQSSESMILNMSGAISLFEVVFDKKDNPFDYRYLTVNPAYENAVGLKASDLIGKTLLEVFPRTETAWLEVFREVSLTSIPDKIEHFSVELNMYYEIFAFSPQKGQLAMLGSNITERKQAEEKIKNLLSEKELILKEVHHRIKNNITSIEGLLSMQLQSISNPMAISALQDALGRVSSMRVLYDKLLITEEYEDISVKNYLESLLDAVVVLFPNNLKITIDKQINDFNLSSEMMFPLGIIVNELLTNIMKYAFKDKKSGLINISLSTINNQVTLTIQDNGNGLPDGFDLRKSNGFGLMLVGMLSEQLGGSFTIDNHSGTRSVLKFDI